MNDRQLRDMIKKSADNVEIPESLRPEQIEISVTSMGQKKRVAQKQKSRRNFYISYAAAAATLLAVCGLTLFGPTEALRKNSLMDKETDHVQEMTEGNTESGTEASKTLPAQEKEEKQPVMESLPKQDAGDLYKVASDYDHVYEVVVSADKYWNYYTSEGSWNVVPTERAEVDIADGMVMPETSSDAKADDLANAAEISVQKQQSGHSVTNVQMEGVDESDIVKTDGSYLYLVADNKIRILDIREGTPKESAVVEIPSPKAFLVIKEIYLDKDRLLVITGESDTKLTEVNVKKKADSKEYYTVTKYKTTLYTYSLENPSQPKLSGCVGQDGTYHTSRKIGDKVYLFTKEMLIQNCYQNSCDSEDWIPMVGEEKVASDCIYLPEKGSNSLIISSIDINRPSEILDHVMIVNNNVNIYVSTEAVYLYHTIWREDQITEIAKFSLKGGAINAVSASSVKGSVRDTFAVNEYQGMFRVLTCSSNRSEGTNLYILDKDLGLFGKLEGIAPGETVYAARYLGDMAYFVTYRNVDPLFAADLSDPANPKILGELKITGYSEYLHMWDNTNMFGIGYETDPDTGKREGIKLSMFDISDPADLKVADSICITNADYSPALDQYKTVLADTGANLIGFVVTRYQKTQKNTYLLFTWREGKLHNLLTQDIGDVSDYYRGVYAGNYFYIITSEKVTAYHRGEDYRKTGEFVF